MVENRKIIQPLALLVDDQGQDGLLWCLSDKLIHEYKRNLHYSVSITRIFYWPIIYSLLSGKHT
jgi:hypothetical protein